MTALRNERGAASIEILVLVPVTVAAIMVIAGGARYADARGQTTSAAFAAARAASLASDQQAAVAAGEDAAERSMAERGHACRHLTVDIDTSDFRRGGSVRAKVSCVADLSDLAGFGLPGHKDFSAAATVPLEQHRDLTR